MDSNRVRRFLRISRREVLYKLLVNFSRKGKMYINLNVKGSFQQK